MYHLFKTFFGVTASAALLILCAYSGCADIPSGKMPDDNLADTVTVVDSAVYGDTLVRCATTIIGAGAATVKCDTTVFDPVSVPYAVSRVDERVNGYCLFPITFTAFPRAEDLYRIEAIYVDPRPGDTGSARIRLSPPEWSAEFAYADTGTHDALMLIEMRGAETVLTEGFKVRTELRVSAGPIVVPIGEVGLEYAIRANGLRHSGAQWVWDLTNINNGIISTRDDSVFIFVDGEYETEIYLYQEDAFGSATPKTAVGFTSVYTTYNVAVTVAGGDAEVLPQREFTVPHAADTSVIVRVDTRNNLKIESVWVNGERWYAIQDRVVADTAVTLEDIRSNVVVLVALAKIDTVQPSLTVGWPSNDTSSAMLCVAGTLGYRLNKRMASGYVKWTEIDTVTGRLIDDAALTVVFPDDLNPSSHIIAGSMAYMSPSDYLKEGLQKYVQSESPRTHKRIDFSARIPNKYRVEMQFSDSLGNKSNTVVRVIKITQSNSGCNMMIPSWLNFE